MEDITSEKLERAHEVLKLINVDKSIQKNFIESVQNYYIDADMCTYLIDNKSKIVDTVAQHYIDKYTLNELNDLIIFYNSSAGKKLLNADSLILQQKIDLTLEKIVNDYEISE